MRSVAEGVSVPINASNQPPRALEVQAPAVPVDAKATEKVALLN
jgi:hypothetical protein